MSRKPSKRKRSQQKKHSVSTPQIAQQNIAKGFPHLSKVGTVIKQQHIISEKHFKGPLPSPEDLAKYKEIDPQLPQIFIDQWGKEADARRQYARAYGRRENARITIVGVYMLILLGAAIWLGYKEQFAYMAGLIASPIVAKVIGTLGRK